MAESLFFGNQRNGGRRSSQSIPARLRASVSSTLRRERQLKSIAAHQVQRMKADGMRPTEIAKTLNIERASVYRVLV